MGAIRAWSPNSCVPGWAVRSEAFVLPLLMLLAACGSDSKAARGEAEPFAVLDNPPADETPLPFADAGPVADPGPGAAEPVYRYCREARAAGVAPLRRGDPGYAPHLDRDGDGIACEAFNGR